MSQFANVDDIRKLFVTKKGMPKKEFLITTTELIENFISDFEEKEKYEKFYIRSIFNSYISYCRNYFRDHNCNWVDPKVEGEIKHGFTKNQSFIELSYNRTEKRKANIAIAARKQNFLRNNPDQPVEQLNLFD